MIDEEDLDDSTAIRDGDYEPSIDDFDDEMKNILSSLDDNIVDKMECAVPIRPHASADNPPLNLHFNEDAGKNCDKLLDVSQLLPSDVRRVNVSSTKSSEVVSETVEQELPMVDMRKQFEQMDIVTTEILQGTRADRQEVQDAINLMRSEIDKSISNNSNPARMFVDNLVKALEVKSTINMTAVKIMEAKAKMLAAMRAGVQIQNNNINHNSMAMNGSVDQSLTELLSNPIGPEDEY